MTVRAKYFSLLLIALCLPFILWAVCGILPTFDDYTSLQSPWWVQIADPGYFFPDSVRRPFDALMGAVVGWKPALFPTLNHILIILGHTFSACLVFTLCQRLKLGALAANIATLFFFFSPATLGATLACDGFNQTYAQLWGLLALWTYLLSEKGRVKSEKYAAAIPSAAVPSADGIPVGNSSLFTLHFSLSRHLWLVCVVMAVLSKENGLAWAVVPPLVAYAFHLIDRRQAFRDIGKGLLVAVVYFSVFVTLTLTGMLEYSNEYSEASLLSHVKDFVQLMAYTWLPIDYMSVVYPPTRNWTIVIITLLLSLPFLVMMLLRAGTGPAPTKSRTLPLLIVCFFILVLPHLLTVVSIMHNYAALSMAALIVAYIVSTCPPHCSIFNQIVNRKSVNRKLSSLFTLHFSLFLMAALFTDVHHYIAARESGLMGRRLATQVMDKTDKSVERTMLICIDNPEEPRYSSFCVRPVDAFAWGLSVRHYSHYEWNIHIDEATLPAYDPQQVETIADSALHSGNDAVWVVGHTKDSVIVVSR